MEIEATGNNDARLWTGGVNNGKRRLTQTQERPERLEELACSFPSRGGISGRLKVVERLRGGLATGGGGGTRIIENHGQPVD